MTIPSPKTNSRRRFFTLLELIAALTVSGFVALIIGTASVTFYNSWRSSALLTERLREYRKIDTVMDTYVRNMIPFNWTDSDNDTASDLLFDGLPDQIFFTSLRRNYSSGSGALLFLRIRVDEGNNLVAEYSEFPRFPWLAEDDPDMPFQREILSKNVRSLKFLYANKKDDLSVEWIDDEWDREANPVLPLAVRMTVVWADGSEESWLRRTAGSGSNSVYGDREEVTANANTATTANR